MKVPRSAISRVVIACMEIGSARSASLFLAPDLVVKATLRGRPDKRCNHTEILMSIGKPNYAERSTIKEYVKAGVAFPCRILQLKWYRPKK